MVEHNESRLCIDWFLWKSAISVLKILWFRETDFRFDCGRVGWFPRSLGSMLGLAKTMWHLAMWGVWPMGWVEAKRLRLHDSSSSSIHHGSSKHSSGNVEHNGFSGEHSWSDNIYFLMFGMTVGHCSHSFVQSSGLVFPFHVFASREAIVCSPLRRTLQTAEWSLATHLSRDVPWYAVEAAREYSQGRLELEPRERFEVRLCSALSSANWIGVGVVSPGHARPCDYRHSVEVQRSSFKRVDFSRVPLGKDTFASRKDLPGPRRSTSKTWRWFSFILNSMIY